MILDIGSGGASKWHKPLKGSNVVRADIDKTCRNIQVVCDIQCLPFLDDVFRLVHASKVLEHVLYPIQAIEELRRVSNDRVVIVVPNASFFKARPSSHNPSHYYSWNEWTLRRLLQKFFPLVNVSKTQKWSLFGNWRLSMLKKIKLMVERTLFGRNELTAVCHKNA